MTTLAENLERLEEAIAAACRRAARPRAEVELMAVSKTYPAATIAEAAGRAMPESPLAWLRLEAESEEKRGAVLRLSIWPHGPIDAKLAVASFHGAWFEWQGVG